MLTHRNFISTLGAAVDIIPGVSESDVYIAYLPLAHSLELVVENGVIAIGRNNFPCSANGRWFVRIRKPSNST